MQVGRSGLMQWVAPTQGRTRSSSPRAELGHQIGVRDVRAGHRHHVEQALADRVPRRLQRRDARRMKDGQPHRLLEGPGAGEERRLG